MVYLVGHTGIALAGLRYGYFALVILVYGVALLASLRADEISRRNQERDLLHRPSERRRDFFMSVPIVLLILLGSSIPLFLILPAFLGRVRSHGPFMTYEDVFLIAIMGSFACLPMAWLWRKALW
jgi:hypothetical protein